MPHRTHQRQHTLWLLAAMFAPIAHFSGCGWLAGTLTALLILPLTLLPGSWEDMPRALAFLEILWLGVTAGTLLKNSAVYWPSDNELVVPLILLALAVCTNASSAPRIGAVLALFAALLVLPLAFSGASKLELQWLKPAFSQWPAGLAIALLLPALPAAGEYGKGRKALGAGALAITATAFVQGMISSGTAAAVRDPFYQTARTLGHLEPVAAAALTLGWYAMAVCLLQSAAIAAGGCGIKGKTATVLAGGTAAAFVILPQQPDHTFVMVLSAFLWVLIPFFHKMNGTEKSEK